MNLIKSTISIGKILHLNPNLTFNNSSIRRYAFKSDLKIKWVHPGKVSCVKPEKSGDLESMPEIDQSQYQLEYRQSKELETANDLAKKLFTLEFAPRYKTTQVYIRNTADTVRRHALDTGSAETRIARWTGAIRAMQELLERFPRNKRLKVNLKELIDKRKKHLKYLRKWDYKRFEWLIDNLNIVYKPPPNEFHWVTRKGSLRKLTQKYCDDLKAERLTAYRRQLESEQPGFLEEKIRSLEFICQEQKECGVEVTVTEEEINEVKRQLEALLKERKEKN
ncbi:hypothetical protein ILUMI_12164 [Ignelater luminosus]|uniref:Small ribosomal subunit protein uS15m n=1 Tax=Ignelater luminosus TaxID=2038154 RepID=A0A8K0CZ04_IGNLU|nr:hypothetical protein ILUMI_12164 [Ignelater luminosus]